MGDEEVGYRDKSNPLLINVNSYNVIAKGWY